MADEKTEQPKNPVTVLLEELQDICRFLEEDRVDRQTCSNQLKEWAGRAAAVFGAEAPALWGEPGVDFPLRAEGEGPEE